MIDTFGRCEIAALNYYIFACLVLRRFKMSLLTLVLVY